MQTHMLTAHPTHQPPESVQSAAEKFKFKVVRVHKTALSRQLHEAMTIGKAEGVILNSKEEYTRCIIPTLSVTHQEIPHTPHQPPPVPDFEVTPASNKR